MISISRRIYNGKVGDVKSRKSVRKLPVSLELKERMLQIAGSEWIFSSRAGTPLDDGNALRRYLRPACEKLGIEIGGWHDFRHTLRPMAFSLVLSRPVSSVNQTPPPSPLLSLRELSKGLDYLRNRGCMRLRFIPHFIEGFLNVLFSAADLFPAGYFICITA